MRKLKTFSIFSLLISIAIFFIAVIVVQKLEYKNFENLKKSEVENTFKSNFNEIIQQNRDNNNLVNFSSEQLKKDFNQIQVLIRNNKCRLLEIIQYAKKSLESDGEFRREEILNEIGMTTKWWLIGPFDNTDKKGFTAIYPPEKEIDFEMSYSGKNNSSLKWFKLNEKYIGQINFNEIFSENEKTVAYALTFLYTPKKTVAYLKTGSDDTVSVWINDKPILIKEIWRAIDLDQETTKISLKKGFNKILVKVCEDWGEWGLYLRIVNENGQFPKGFRYFYTTKQKLGGLKKNEFIERFNFLKKLRDIKTYKQRLKQAEELNAIYISAETSESLAYTYLQLGILNRAKFYFNKYYLKSIKKIVEIQAKDLIKNEADELTNELWNLYLAKNYEVEIEKAKTAISFYEAINQEGGRLMDALYFLGQVYQEVSREEEGIELIKKSLTMAEVENNYFRMAGCFNEIGNYYFNKLKDYNIALENYLLAKEIAEREGIKHYIKISTGNIGSVYWAVANDYYDEDNYEEAIKYYSKALSFVSEKVYSSQLHYGMGLSYYYLGQYNIALEKFNDAIRLNPEYGEAFFKLGSSYRELKKNDEAVEAFKKAILLKADDERYYTVLGSVYCGKKMYAEAIRVYEKALEINPDYAFALNNLGWLYAMAEDKRFFEPEKALELAQKAVSIYASAAYLSTLAEAYFINGEVDKALETIELSLKKYSELMNVDPEELETVQNQLKKFKKVKERPKR